MFCFSSCWENIFDVFFLSKTFYIFAFFSHKNRHVDNASAGVASLQSSQARMLSRWLVGFIIVFGFAVLASSQRRMEIAYVTECKASCLNDVL